MASDKFTGYTERNFPRYYETGPHPVVLAFDYDVQEALRGSNVRYNSDLIPVKQSVESADTLSQGTSVRGKAADESKAHGKPPTGKKKTKGGLTSSQDKSGYAFGTKVGASCSVPRKSVSDMKEEAANSKHQRVPQLPTCRWANALSGVLIRYQQRLEPPNYAERLVKIGDAVFEQKEYLVARDVCYRRLAIPACISKTSYEESLASISDGAPPPPPPRAESENSLEMAAKATCGFLKCEFALLVEQDSQFLNASTSMSALQLLHNWHDVGIRTGQYNRLCFLTRNVTINIYLIAMKLLPNGYALQAAPYVQWCCTALEHVLPLRRIRHVKWRGQLYTAACLLYSAAGMPVQSEVIARRALEEFLHVKTWEEGCGNGAEVDKVAFDLLSTMIQINIMIFRRNVFESRKRPKGVLRPRLRLTLKEMEPLPWPRNDVERLLIKQFPWGRSSQFVALMQSIEDPRRRILRSSKADPFLYMEKPGNSPSGSAGDRQQQPSADTSAGNITPESQPPSVLGQHQDNDSALLMDVWYELFYAAADLVGTALGIEGPIERVPVDWVDSVDTDRLMDLAAERKDAITSESAVSLLKYSYCYEMWDIVDFLLPPILERLAASACNDDIVLCKHVEIISAVRCIQNQLDTKCKRQGGSKSASAGRNTEKISLVSPPETNELRPEQMEALWYLSRVLDSCMKDPIKNAGHLDHNMVNDALLLLWAAANPFFCKLNELAEGSEEMLQQEHLHLWLQIAYTVANGMDAFGIQSSDHQIYSTVSMKLALLLEVISKYIASIEQPLPAKLISVLRLITGRDTEEPVLNTVPLRPASLSLQTVTPESQSRAPSHNPSLSRMNSRAPSRSLRTASSKSGRVTRGQSRAASRRTASAARTSRPSSHATRDGGQLPPIATTPSTTSETTVSKSSIPTLPQISSNSIMSQSITVPSTPDKKLESTSRTASSQGQRDTSSTRLESVAESRGELSLVQSSAAGRISTGDQSRVSFQRSKDGSGALSVSTQPSYMSTSSQSQQGKSTALVLAGDRTLTMGSSLPASKDDQDATLVQQHLLASRPSTFSILKVADTVLRRCLNALDAVGLVADYSCLTTDEVLFMVQGGPSRDFETVKGRQRAEMGNTNVDLLHLLYRIKLRMLCTRSQETDMNARMTSCCETMMLDIRQNKRGRAILLVAAARLLNEPMLGESKDSRQMEEHNAQLAVFLEEAYRILFEESETEAAKRSVHSLPAMMESWKEPPMSRGPPPPLVVCCHGDTVRLVPQPFTPMQGEQVATIRLFACQATGVQPKARLDSYQLKGTGLDIPYNEQASFTIRGLKKNVQYIFAVAAYTSDGTLVGKAVGESTAPYLVSKALPLVPVTGILSKCALQCRHAPVVEDCGTLLWKYFIDDKWLREFALAMPAVYLHHFVHTALAMFKCRHETLNTADSVVFSGSALDPKELQAQRLGICRQLLLVMEVINDMNDVYLALQVVVMIFCIMVQEVQLQVASADVLDAFLVCHCILQEMLEVAGGNEKLRNLMITDYRVQLLSAIIANYVEQCYAKLHQHSKYKELSAESLAFRTAVVSDTLRYLSDATGYVLQPVADAMASQGSGTTHTNPSISRQASLTTQVSRGSQRPLSMAKVPLKLIQQQQPEVIKAIQALIEGVAYNVTVSPIHGRLPSLAYDDRCQLHSLINKSSPEDAFNELRRCMKRAHFLEFFTRLVDVSIQKKKLKSVVEWSVDSFAWLRRRNELILRKEKTEADERLQNSLIVATKNLGRSLSFVECNAPEETPGRDITLMDIGGPDKKQLRQDWKHAMKGVPPSFPKDNRHIWRALFLQARLPVLWRLGRNRKRLRAVSLEEMPWRSRLNYLLAKVYFSLFMDEVQSQVARLSEGSSDLDRCRVQPSWYDLGTAGGIVVGSGSLSEEPSTFNPRDLEGMTEDEKVEAITEQYAVDLEALYPTKRPQAKPLAIAAPGQISDTAAAKVKGSAAVSGGTIAVMPSDGVPPQEDQSANRDLPDISETPSDREAVRESAAAQKSFSTQPSETSQSGLPQQAVLEKQPSEDKQDHVSRQSSLQQQSSLQSMSSMQSSFDNQISVDSTGHRVLDRPPSIDKYYAEQQILLARAALGEIHEDPPTEILTPAKLLTSKKLEALKTHLRRSIVLASRCKSYLLLQETVRLLQNVQKEILSTILSAVQALVMDAATINKRKDILNGECLPQAVRDAEVQCCSLMHRSFYKITFAAADALQDMLDDVSRMQPKFLDGLLEKFPYSMEDDGALLAYLARKEQLETDAVDKTSRIFQGIRNQRQKPSDRSRAPKVKHVTGMPLFNDLTFNPALDDSTAFGVDIHWLLSFMLASLQRLFLQSQWEMVVDVGTRFNAATKDACALQLCPVLVAAQQHLAAKLEAKQQIVVRTPVKRYRARVLKRIREAVHVDPGRERVYDHIRCHSARPVNHIPVAASLKAVAGELRQDMHLLYHSRLLRMTYLAGCTTGTPRTESGVPAGGPDCTVCCQAGDGVVDWKNRCMAYAVGQTVSVGHVIASYHKAIDLLTKTKERSLVCQAQMELGSLLFHTGDVEEACVCWETCLEDLLESTNCPQDWRYMARGDRGGGAKKSRPEIPASLSKDVNPLDTSSQSLLEVSSAMLARCDVWGCLLGAQAAIRLARYSCFDQLDMQAECCLIASTLIMGVLRASQPYSGMTELEFADYVVRDPRSVVLNVDLFTDKHRCDATSLTHDLMWLCQTLYDGTFFLQTLPILWFLRCIATHITRSVDDVTRTVCLQVEALSKLRVISKATSCLISVLTGHGMPLKLKFVDAACSRKTAPLVLLSYQDQLTPQACENAKTLMYICSWSSHRSLTHLYGKALLDRIDMATAHYLTEIAASIPLANPTKDDVHCARRLKNDGGEMLDFELAPNLSVTELATPSPKRLDYATAAAVKLVLVQRAAGLFEAVHNMNIAVTAELSVLEDEGPRDVLPLPPRAKEVEILVRCRLGLSRIAMVHNQYLTAAHHSKHALRNLEMYGDRIEREGREQCDLTVGHSYVTSGMWLRARLQLVQALSAVPSVHDRQTEDDKLLESVAAHCNSGITEADSMSSRMMGAEFRACLAADQIKASVLGMKTTGYQCMIESFEIILKHHKPLPSAVRDMAFRYLPTIAKCLDLITSGQQDGDVASLKQLGIMSTPDVFSKLLQLAQEELSIVERESLGAPMSNTLLQHHHPIAEALVNRGLLALTAGEKQRSVLRAIQEMANWTTNAVDIPPRLKLELRVTESLLMLHREASGPAIAECIKLLANALRDVDRLPLHDYGLVMNLQSTLAIFHMWCSSIADLRAPPESAGSLGRAESSAATSSPNVPSRSGSRQPSPMWPGSATTAWNLVRAVGTTYRASLAHRQPDNCEYAKEVEAIYLAHMPTALRRCLCGPHVGENELPMLTTPDQPDVIEKESVAVTADTRLWRCEHTPTWQELVLYRHHLSKLCSSQVVCQFPGLYSTLPQGTCGELMTMRDVTDAFLVRHCPVYQANCSPRMQLIGWKTASCVPSNFQEHFESVKQLVQEKSCSGQSHHSRVSAARSSLSSKESAPPKSNKFSYAWWHPGLLGINDHSVGEQQSVIQYVIDSLRDVECDCLPTADTVILLYSVGKSSLSEPASGKDFKSVCVGCHLISQTCLSELVSKLSGLLNTVTVVGKDPAEGSRSEARDSSNKSQGTNPAVLDGKELGDLKRDLYTTFRVPEDMDFMASSPANLEALRSFLDSASTAGDVTNKSVRAWLQRALVAYIP